MKRPLLLVVPAALAVPLAMMAGSMISGADAQVFKNHDSNAPVNFTADRIEVQDRADRVIVSGNVVVTQAGMTLTAARMTVAYRKQPTPASAAANTSAPANANANANNGSGVEIDRIDASGNVVVTQADQTARGNVAIYDLNTRLITMLGNVVLDQGANHLTGGRLVIDLTSGRSTVDGRSAGGGAGVSSGAGGRVSGTFTVPQRK